MCLDNFETTEHKAGAWYLRYIGASEHWKHMTFTLNDSILSLKSSLRHHPLASN